MVNKTLLVFGILNAIIGCTAGIILVSLTGNSFYYILNGISGGTLGIILGGDFSS